MNGKERAGKPIEELKLAGNLPSPTGVGLAILELTRGEDYSMGDVTRVIQTDPALTGRILRIANSAVSSPSQPITSVSQAAMRLGVRSVRNVALGFSLVSGNRSGGCRSFDYERYWASSLAVAVAAQALAEEVRGVTPTDAFTCGLLSDIGSLALASIHPERYSEVLRRAHVGGESLLLAERELLDIDHVQLGCALISEWGLPESFAHALASSDAREPEVAPSPEAQRLARLLRQALALAPHISAGGATGELPEGLDLDAARLGTVIARCRADWLDWSRTLQLPSAAREPSAGLVPTAGLEGAPTCAVTQARRKPGSGLRILAVDDDPVSLRLIALHLSRAGHEVIRATTGREALLAALEHAPQMVITDWMMPDMDGLELCRTLRSTEECRGMYVIVLTGRDRESRAVEAFDAGADEYFLKPFESRLLLARVGVGQRTIELREQVESDRRIQAQQVADMSVLNRKLEAAAMTDVLTRLPNRRFALRRLEEDLSIALASDTALSVVMIDIDYFKLVNDEHGHGMGDLVLRETANVLRGIVRREDTVCRLGGEEFLVVCPGANLEHATATAERMRRAVAHHVISFGYGRPVTISAGVAQREEGADSVDDLLRVADRRVYLAKAAGRDQVCSEDPPPPHAKSA
ncbi:MAG: HDOD domain-containing protein [Planctomycetes bacterium]|nr:HDOD domain-containing protein [Planctomycetota bacterium]